MVRRIPFTRGASGWTGVNHWSTEQKEESSTVIPPGQDRVVLFTPRLPADFPPTRPYWHRDNPAEDSLNTIDEPQYTGLPFPPPALMASAIYSIP